MPCRGWLADPLSYEFENIIYLLKARCIQTSLLRLSVQVSVFRMVNVGLCLTRRAPWGAVTALLIIWFFGFPET